MIKELENRFGSVETVMSEIRVESRISGCNKCTSETWGDDRCSECKGSAWG